MRDEYFDLVDDDNRVIGRATRAACHGNPALIHRAVHILVINQAGELYLQKRSARKDVQPGKWDTSVGGHLDAGEDFAAAALREAREELGLALTLADLKYLYDYKLRGPGESENIRTYLYHCRSRAITPSADEIEEGKFMDAREIAGRLGSGFFTPNFEDEWARYTQYIIAQGAKQ